MTPGRQSFSRSGWEVGRSIAGPRGDSRPRDRSDETRRTATLALLAFAMLIVSLDQYIVVVALPEIGRDLGFSDQSLQAVISAYAIASAGLLLLGGRAADVLGRRRILVTGLVLYAGASLVGALAPVPVILLIARAVQGLGGALVFPATLSLVNTTFVEAESATVWSTPAPTGWPANRCERRPPMA